MTLLHNPTVELAGWTEYRTPTSINWEPDADGGQALAELASRLCYRSHRKPNPATATNATYLANILRQRHESVFEHASVTFYVAGVSRTLLTELSRHRHISLSVVSQRYVDESQANMIVPPAVDSDDMVKAILSDCDNRSRAVYETLVKHLTAEGLPRKQAREVARSVLPNMTETQFFVTANLRAWRDVLGRRWHVAADAEIRRWAGLVLDELRKYAPNVFQDFPADPFGSEGQS